MKRIRHTCCLGLLASWVLLTGTVSAAPALYRLHISPNGIQFGNTADFLIKNIRYEADDKNGLAFATAGIQRQQTVPGATRLVFALTGPAAAQASVTAVLTPLPGGVGTHWEIAYAGPARDFDPWHTGFRLDYTQPIQSGATVPAIQFVAPTGAKPYEVKGDTPYRDLEWQLRETIFAQGRLVLATEWYDSDWIYRRQYGRAAMLKATLPTSSPTQATYDFSLVSLPPTGPGVGRSKALAADVAAAAAGRPLSLMALCNHAADLFAPGEPVRFALRVRNVTGDAQAGRLQWTVWDYDGHAVAGGTDALNLAAGSVQAVPVVIRGARRGMLFLDARLSGKGENRIDRTTFGILAQRPPSGPLPQRPPSGPLPQRPPSGPLPQSHFGLAGLICDPITYPDQKSPSEVLALAQRAGARWVRIGAHLAPAGDAAADADAQMWQTLLPRYGLTAHVQVHTGLPAAGNAAFWNEARASIQRYHGLTSDIEFGNELNLAGVSPQDYVNDLLRPVHDIMRAVYPGGKIMSMGLGGVDKTWLDGFVAAGGMNLTDVLSIHPGDQPRAPEFWKGWRGWVFRPQVLDALAAAGGKPVWISEAYAPTPPERSQLDVRTAADYTVRTNVLALALGVRVVEWYQLQDGTWFAQRPNPADTEYNYGLVYTDLTPKPGYIAYAVMTGQLEGAECRGRLDLGAEDLYGIRFTRGAGTVDALWSYREKSETDLAWWPPAQFQNDSRRPGEPWQNRWRHPVSVRLPATGPVTVTDLMGNARTLRPQAGFVTLALSGSPIYVTGLGAISVRPHVWP